jgi:hypothetical protein
MARNKLRSSKIEERYTGPFKVKERCANGSYMLVDAVGTVLQYRIPGTETVQYRIPGTETASTNI